MNRSDIVRNLQRMMSVYHDVGLAGVASRLLRRIRRAVGYDDPAHAEWLRNKIAADSAFDAANGIQTGGVQHIPGLQVLGENARHATSHVASDPSEFASMMPKVGIDHDKFTFVDLGAEKGRALFMAAAFPFHRIIGVEFAVDLYEAAKTNLAVLKEAGAVVRDIELVCGDAASYEFPLDPLVIYLFNPSVLSSCAAWRNVHSLHGAVRLAPSMSCM